MPVNLICWNVNGIRAIMKKDFLASVEAMKPDVLCLQETKAQVEDARTALELLPGYKTYVNSSKGRKGYSGTAILAKQEPLDITEDIGIEEHDQEGRVITAEFDKYYLVTVYVPNSGQKLVRLDYRKTWDEAFLKYLKALEEKKPVVVCGDFNVAHQEIDIARPKQNYNKSAGYTQDEIDGFGKFLSAGFVDTFRHFYPEEVKYSYWNYMFNSRDRNVGWRIDYFLVSESAMGNVKSASIYNEYYGSDHCPIGLEINL